jgi:ABC-type sulfate/molybdate transport systems ATPase subunit
MNIEFRVHTVANSHSNVKAEVNGETINALAPALEVELVPASGSGGSLTLRVIGGQMEEAKGIFKENATIVADFVNKESYAEKKA